MADKKQSTTLKHYSYDGELFPAKEKKHSEVIFFVHFYMGNKKALRRHIELVNELGFDAFAFNLKGGNFNPKDWLLKLKLPDSPISSKGELGIKNIYADQIEHMLNEVPGKKIVFSFSNLGISTIQALAQRSCNDITALICDSGPSNRLPESVMNLAKEQFGISNYFLRASFLPLFIAFWDPYLHQQVHEHLRSFPKDFPILSIRGWKDSLIPANSIDEVFDRHEQLQWEKLSLPEAEHLKGLKDFSSEYIPGLKKFLNQHFPENSSVNDQSQLQQ